jgi:hypothetical protein
VTSPVDVVYTWVDGDDPAWRTLLQQHARTPSDRNPERYRDMYSMLKYSLRSLERHARWIRDLYFFTCRPQVPAWLNVEHPRVHVVHHDEIIDAQYLPTFSSRVIESYLHELPNPSELMLCLDDDFFLGRDTTLGDFLTHDGRIKVYGTLIGERFRFRVYAGKFNTPSVAFLEHVPLLVYKPFWREMLASTPSEVHRTRRNRFRRDTDLKMLRLYRYHLLARRRAYAQVVPVWRYLQHIQFHKIGGQLARQEARLRRIRRRRPKFFCLNDNQRDQPDPDVVRLVQEFLDDYFPEKSQYEL